MGGMMEWQWCGGGVGAAGCTVLAWLWLVPANVSPLHSCLGKVNTAKPPVRVCRSYDMGSGVRNRCGDTILPSTAPAVEHGSGREVPQILSAATCGRGAPPSCDCDQSETRGNKHPEVRQQQQQQCPQRTNTGRAASATDDMALSPLRRTDGATNGSSRRTILRVPTVPAMQRDPQHGGPHQGVSNRRSSTASTGTGSGITSHRRWSRMNS